jgi:hypothetical protein
VEYRSTDAAGNAEDVKSLTVKVDRTAPVTTASTDPATPNGTNGWFTTAVNVALATGTDEATEYKVGTGDWTTYTAPLELSADGTYTVGYRSTDKAGNVEKERSLTVKVDRTAPTVACSVLNPANGQIWPPNGRMIEVTTGVKVTDATSGSAGFVLAAVTSDEGDAAKLTDRWSIGTPDTAGRVKAERLDTGDGRVYGLRYVAKDQAGNTATCTAEVTVPKALRPTAQTASGSAKRLTGALVTVAQRQQLRTVSRSGLGYVVECGKGCRVSASLRTADGRLLGRSAARSIKAGRGQAFALGLGREALASAVRAAGTRAVRATLTVTVRSADGDRAVRKAITIRR